MSRRIQDEFTNLPLSKQRKYQLRRAKEKRCIICGSPAVSTEFCAKHMVAHMVRARERMRRRKKAVRRNLNSPSYSLQKTKTLPPPPPPKPKKGT